MRLAPLRHYGRPAAGDPESVAGRPASPRLLTAMAARWLRQAMTVLRLRSSRGPTWDRGD